MMRYAWHSLLHYIMLHSENVNTISQYFYHLLIYNTYYSYLVLS